MLGTGSSRQTYTKVEMEYGVVGVLYVGSIHNIRYSVAWLWSD